MAEKRDSETAQSIASNETEECEKKWQWSELPSLPLENIYSFLRRPDQVNMSLVCRKWSKGYGLPSVWKKFTFDLRDSQLSKDTCNEMKFVRKYSRMFRHVKIDCDFDKRRFIERWCGHFIEFLQILTSNSQLHSLKLEHLSSSLRHIGIPTYDKICRALADFLGSQHHLKRVGFHYCTFGFNEGVEFLRKLTEHSRESLTHLVLRGFVDWESLYQQQDLNVFQHLPKLADLPSLTTLETDYSLIFENMVASRSDDIQTIKCCQTRILSKIILNYTYVPKEFEYFRGLTSNDWKFLKILYPNLQIELSIGFFDETRPFVEFLIVPNMPITRLEYIKYNSYEETDIAVLFYHPLACKTNDHLVTLHLKGIWPIQTLSSTFIPFVQACKKLKCLELFTISPANGIDLLLKSWLENPPESLEKVIIDVSSLDVEDAWPPSLVNLTSQYVSLLELKGSKIRVTLYIGKREIRGAELLLAYFSHI